MLNPSANGTGKGPPLQLGSVPLFNATPLPNPRATPPVGTAVRNSTNRRHIDDHPRHWELNADMRMTRIALVIAGVGLVSSWSLVAADGTCATATPKQLTWSCGDVCEEYIPCLVFDASACDGVNCTIAADQECAYQCFKDFYIFDLFAELLIPYGRSYQSEEEVADRKALGNEAYDAQFDTFYDYTGDNSWASNDDLDSIATVKMNPNISEL
jgi:hypothetical protein